MQKILTNTANYRQARTLTDYAIYELSLFPLRITCFSRFPPRFLLALCLGRMGSGAVMTGPI
jgi:hypothetical protein